MLANGTNTYLYGNARLGQYQTAMQYFGADGLGSVRQLYDASAQVVGSTRYDPYGNVMSQGGTATSVQYFGTDGLGGVPGITLFNSPCWRKRPFTPPPRTINTFCLLL